MPEYTNTARREHKQGKVKMIVVVEPSGRARSIHVVRSAGYDLDERSVETIRGWKFKPATKDGQPITVCVIIETAFRLY